MNRLLVVVGVAVLFAAGAVWAQEYWPIGDAVSYHYEVGGQVLDVSFSAGMRECYYPAQEETCMTWEGFAVGEGGDVLLSSNMNYCSGAIDPDYMWTFSPPATFLDLPLFVGKTWSTSTTASGYGSYPCVLSFEVLRQEVVTVPLGTFEVMVVYQTPSICHEGGTYYVHRQLGPVILPGGFRLVSANGIVATERLTWGGLKALFR